MKPAAKPESMKAVIPLIAPALGMSWQTLYERQRALVRKGLLKKPVGRGRGSGQTPTLEAVAILVAATMMTDNLCEVVKLKKEEIRKLAADVARRIGRGSSITYRRPSAAEAMFTVTTLPPSASRVILKAIRA